MPKSAICSLGPYNPRRVAGWLFGWQEILAAEGGKEWKESPLLLRAAGYALWFKLVFAGSCCLCWSESFPTQPDSSGNYS